MGKKEMREKGGDMRRRFTSGRWAKTREMGKRKFVLVYGVFFFGLLSALLSSLIMKLSMPVTVVQIIINLIVFPVCGVFWGAWMWRVNEKRWK
ncbi:hypothetical protein STSP2_00308 [Anaerohalosphaera lusitana]|uniref:Uncharacterized protein n=1 Tax=Anaerohalosphaera lusitana TaxID=1936003 RepID=A0A1U9NH87_9BACT|nr:hypothetical protein [Anaerohalosphaera lusitana]AQT67165.1 hypothetical protein STSP2_00308 [Anaerohalosphaera lusitana]